MLLIYLRVERDGHPAGTVIGEHQDDRRADALAQEYGADYGVACLPTIPENLAWLERTVPVVIRERVWARPLAQSATPKPGYAEARDGAGNVIYVRPAHAVIGGVQPDETYELRQEEAVEDRRLRAGVLSVDPAPGTILFDGRPAPAVQTAEAIHAETAAAIRSRYSVGQELQMHRLALTEPEHEEVVAYQNFVEAAVATGTQKKAALPS